jgi:hypothetical protein
VPNGEPVLPEAAEELPGGEQDDDAHPSSLPAFGRTVSGCSTAVASSIPCEKPDFSGRWRLCNVEGDFELFLADIGTSYLMRKLAKGANYGVGKAVQDISADGDLFSLVSQVGLKVTSMKMRIGGAEEESVGMDGNPVLVKSKWEGAVLVMENRRPDNTPIPATRRYLEEEFMVLENTTTTGVVVKRRFSKDET